MGLERKQMSLILKCFSRDKFNNNRRTCQERGLKDGKPRPFQCSQERKNKEGQQGRKDKTFSRGRNGASYGRAWNHISSHRSTFNFLISC